MTAVAIGTDIPIKEWVSDAKASVVTTVVSM